MITASVETRTFHEPLDAEGWVGKMRAAAAYHGVNTGVVHIEAVDSVGITAQVQVNGEQEAIQAARKDADAAWAEHLEGLKHGSGKV